MTYEEKLKFIATGELDESNCITLTGYNGDSATALARLVHDLRNMGHKVAFKPYIYTNYSSGYLMGSPIPIPDFQWTYNGVLIDDKHHYYIADSEDHGNVYLIKVQED